MFVPSDLLPDASVGDVVDVTSLNPPAIRRGVVTDQVEDDNGRFVTVSFGGEAAQTERAPARRAAMGCGGAASTVEGEDEQ